MLRRRMMMERCENIPVGYQRCEYLQGLGTDKTYIIIPKIDITNKPYVKIEVEYPVYTADTNAFGSLLNNIRFEQGIGWGGGAFSYNLGNGYGTVYPQSSNAQLANGSIVSAASLAKRKIKIEYKNGSIYLNDVEQTKAMNEIYVYGNLGVANDVYLFGTNRGEVKRYFNGKIYSFYVEEQIELVPAIDPLGKPCMFDRLSHRPFYNAGTGEFLYG